MRTWFEKCPQCGYKIKPQLTENEKRTVQFIVVDALCNKQIAQRLGVEVRTVKKYVRDILKAYEVKTRLELAIKYHSEKRIV